MNCIPLLGVIKERDILIIRVIVCRLRVVTFIPFMKCALTGLSQGIIMVPQTSQLVLDKRYNKLAEKLEHSTHQAGALNEVFGDQVDEYLYLDAFIRHILVTQTNLSIASLIPVALNFDLVDVRLRDLATSVFANNPFSREFNNEVLYANADLAIIRAQSVDASFTISYNITRKLRASTLWLVPDKLSYDYFIKCMK